MAMDLVTGFYGKLPSHGDFIGRGLPDEFVGPWDRWLQNALADLRGEYGRVSDDAYLAGPSWRFVLGRGVAGRRIWVGVIIPSTDRVGRQFPLSVVAGLPEEASVFRSAALSRDWLDRIESIALGVRGERQNDLDALLHMILSEAARLPPAARLTRSADVPEFALDDALGWRFRLPQGAAIDLGMIDVLEQIALSQFPSLSLWWTAGAEGQSPVWRCEDGWPSRQLFPPIGLMPDDPPPAEPAFTETEVRWPAHAELSSLLMPDPVEVQSSGRLVIDGVAVAAAAWTDTGKVRGGNEDAHFLGTDRGLWAVADGMGGHAYGEIASRMVVEALSGLRPGPSLKHDVAGVLDRFREINKRLRQMASDPKFGFDSGTTVVAMLLRGREAAVAWVGDSRLYRLRQGQLELLTHDHSTEAEMLQTRSTTILDLLAMPAGELTRAIGGDNDLSPDVIFFEVEADDRMLLCTDGLYSEVAEAGIAAALKTGNPEEVVLALAKQFLASAASDNATAVVLVVS